MTAIYTWFVSRLTALRAHHERGAAAVEYGLLVALIAVVILAAVTALGGGVKGTFCKTVKGLGFADPACP
jgi:pilus assembly protein Flp/PilA